MVLKLREKLLELLKEKLPKTSSNGLDKFYFAPNIPKEKMRKMISEFDITLKSNEILAFTDITLFGGCSNGYLYTEEGFYFCDLFEDPYYVNYNDLNLHGFGILEETKLSVTLTSGKSLIYGSCAPQGLKDLLRDINEELSTNIETSKSRKSGSVKLESKKDKCHAIIHGAAVAAGGIGAGLAQVPLADTIPITGLQIGMIVSIAKVFGVELTEGAAKGWLGGAAGSIAGRQVVGLLVGWVPGIGNAIKGGTASLLTEAIGWAAVKHFENLEQETEDAFKHGMKAGEKNTKEKFEKILKTVKNRDYFLISAIVMIFYMNDNKIDIEAEKRIEIMLSSLDLFYKSIIEMEIKKIREANNLKEVKNYVEKIEKESLTGLEELIKDFSTINPSSEKNYKKDEILSMIDEMRQS